MTNSTTIRKHTGTSSMRRINTMRNRYRRRTPVIHAFYYLALLFTFSTFVSIHAWITNGARRPSFARSKPTPNPTQTQTSDDNNMNKVFRYKENPNDEQDVKTKRQGRRFPLKAIQKQVRTKLLDEKIFDQNLNLKQNQKDVDVDVDAKADISNIIQQEQEKESKNGRSVSSISIMASSDLPLPYYIDTEAPMPMPITETESEMKRTRKRVGSSERKEPKKPLALVTNPHELRAAVLDRGIQLKDIAFNNTSFVPRLNVNATKNTKAKAKSKTKTKRGVTAPAPVPEMQLQLQSQNEDTINKQFNPLNHEVIKLINMRAKTNSKPGARAFNDTATLALSIEGGGMRGAVSAGMASAIAVLGLSDSFDSIYGSSAGSVVGAYMVSRQMCIDVYTDVLTTAKSRFASRGRLASSLATNLIDSRVLNRTNMFSRYTNPAMNISFVLDSIMCPEQGLRPLDLKTFQRNDERQQLRVVTSTVREGKMETHCLGSRTMDFFDRIDNSTGQVIENATTMVGMDRHGFFACLETSMLVPAATGPPLSLIRNRDAQLNITTRCFDAFCYEPIPYRSAVEEGASHVLVLKTRPDGSKIGTKPGLFEKVFAPMYFDTNNMPQVADYFKNGGQQYIYTEDYLTLDEGKAHIVDENDPSTAKGVIVPPRKILYGVERDEEAQQLATNRNEWKRAHLLPLAVPEGKPELNVLSVDQDEVLEGVRLGFAAAFNMLAPAANIELNAHLDGERVAELLFSHVGTAINVLEIPVPIAGDFIWESEESHNCRVANGDVSPSTMEKAVERDLRNAYFMQELEIVEGAGAKPCNMRDASELLDSLPGFRRGKMQSLSKGLHQLSQRKADTSL